MVERLVLGCARARVLLPVPHLGHRRPELHPAVRHRVQARDRRWHPHTPGALLPAGREGEASGHEHALPRAGRHPVPPPAPLPHPRRQHHVDHGGRVLVLHQPLARRALCRSAHRHASHRTRPRAHRARARACRPLAHRADAARAVLHGRRNDRLRRSGAMEASATRHDCRRRHRYRHRRLLGTAVRGQPRLHEQHGLREEPAFPQDPVPVLPRLGHTAHPE